MRWARIDQEIGQGLRARNQRRRKGLDVVLKRDEQMYLLRSAVERPITLDTLHMITGFETYDALGVPGRSFDDDVAILIRMANDAIGFTTKVVPPH